MRRPGRGCLIWAFAAALLICSATFICLSQCRVRCLYDFAKAEDIRRVQLFGLAISERVSQTPLTSEMSRLNLTLPERRILVYDIPWLSGRFKPLTTGSRLRHEHQMLMARFEVEMSSDDDRRGALTDFWVNSSSIADYLFEPEGKPMGKVGEP